MDTEYCHACGILHDPNDGDCQGCKLTKRLNKFKKCVEFYAGISSPLAKQINDNEECNHDLEGYYEMGGKRARQCLEED